MSTPISQTRADLVPVIASKYRDILRDLGEDTNREGLLDTPLRAAQALLFFTKVTKIQNLEMRLFLIICNQKTIIQQYYCILQGYEDSIEHAVKNAVFEEHCDNMVVVKDIEMFSLCEHHLVPFMGKVSIGYIPKGIVLL